MDMWNLTAIWTGTTPEEGWTGRVKLELQGKVGLRCNAILCPSVKIRLSSSASLRKQTCCRGSVEIAGGILMFQRYRRRLNTMDPSSFRFDGWIKVYGLPFQGMIF